MKRFNGQDSEPLQRAKPDWRSVETYSSLKKYSKKAWGWEFLRRNPKYRAEWLHLLKEALDKGEILDSSTCGYLVGNAETLKTWGLKCYYSPEDTYPSEFDFDPLPNFIIGAKHPLIEIGKASSVNKAHQTAVTIDLHANIDTQMTHIAEEAKLLQKQLGLHTVDNKKRSDTWIRYLQIFDAMDDLTVTTKDIYIHIYGSKDLEESRRAYNEARKQAKQWVNVKFKELILSQ